MSVPSRREASRSVDKTRSYLIRIGMCPILDFQSTAFSWRRASAPSAATDAHGVCRAARRDCPASRLAAEGEPMRCSGVVG